MQHACTHTHKVPVLQPLRWSLSWALDTASRPAHPEVAEGLHLSALHCVHWNTRQRHWSKSKAPHISKLPVLKAWMLSNSLVLFVSVCVSLYVCVCVYLMWSMIYLNSLMACTVFAQTLKTRCCCGRSSEGVNLSATSGYACQNPSLSPYLCHSTFIIPSLLQSPHLSWPSLTSPYYHLSSTMTCDDDVTLMPVSCSDCVLEIICILSVLACCTSVWSPGII